MLVTLFFTQKSNTREAFLVANRKVGMWEAALSIAATWIWAPALFVSAEKAYNHGIVGLFWFLVPNVLCLIIFAPFAVKIRKQMPHGVTLSGFMREKYSKRVKNIYLIQLTIIALLSTVVQLLAGGKMFSAMTGLPFWLMTILFSIIAYSYSQFSGIKASVVTDATQMITMLIVCAILVPWSLFKSGIGAVKQGIGGVSGNYNNLFDKYGLEIFLAFGLSTTIGLMSGPFGDQSFWQRAFSIKKDKVKRAFIIGALIFALVPLCMGIIGFIAAGTGFQATNSGMVNLEFIFHTLPKWTVYPFMFILISGLISTIDSNLCSIASLTDDIFKEFSIDASKKSMIILIIGATALANVPGLTVGKLFLIYGTVRASTLFTTILTLKQIELTEKGVFYGVIASLIVGLPIFIYGTLKEISTMKVIGSLVTALLSGFVAIIITRREKRARQKTIN